jgi:hypothetical protein
MGERKQLRALRWSWGKLAILSSWLLVAGLAFYLGRVCLTPQATAAPPHNTYRAQDPPPAPAPTPPSGDYHNVVAYVSGNVPITREDLGEYLIARMGAERLDMLINHRIVDMACKQAGIEVTPQEMDQALTDDLKSLNCDKKQFVNTVLKQYGKTLYEWREDVIRPKLMLGKLCRARVTVEEQDLHNAFEAKYGEQVEGRIILWPKGEEHIALRMYGDIRGSDDKFADAAQQQASPELAGHGGKIRPIGHFTTGCPDLEKAVFRLQPGQMTELIGVPEGTVVFKCDKRIAAQDKKLEQERPFLEQEIIARKTTIEIGKVFDELKKQAKPVNLMKQEPPSQAEREAEAEQLLKEGGIPVPKFGQAPSGH